MSDFGFWQTLEVRTLGCTRRFIPLPTRSSPNRWDLHYQTAHHKRHKIFTGSGHHCGVIPYSSVWCVDCLLGLMMNSTRQNSLARGCSWRVRRTARRGSIALSTGFLVRIRIARSGPDASTLGVASPIYRQRPWASPQILSGKGANNWPF